MYLCCILSKWSFAVVNCSHQNKALNDLYFLISNNEMKWTGTDFSTQHSILIQHGVFYCNSGFTLPDKYDIYRTCQQSKVGQEWNRRVLVNMCYYHNISEVMFFQDKPNCNHLVTWICSLTRRMTHTAIHCVTYAPQKKYI